MHGDNNCLGLVGPEEIADAFGVARETVLRWAQMGKIPSVNVTHKVVRFQPQDVMEAIDGGREDGAEVRPE